MCDATPHDTVYRVIYLLQQIHVRSSASREAQHNSRQAHTKFPCCEGIRRAEPSSLPADSKCSLNSHCRSPQHTYPHAQTRSFATLGAQGHGKVAFMQPGAALACAAGRGGGDGWPLLCCRSRPGAGD